MKLAIDLGFHLTQDSYNYMFGLVSSIGTFEVNAQLVIDSILPNLKGWKKMSGENQTAFKSEAFEALCQMNEDKVVFEQRYAIISKEIARILSYSFKDADITVEDDNCKVVVYPDFRDKGYIEDRIDIELEDFVLDNKLSQSECTPQLTTRLMEDFWKENELYIKLDILAKQVFLLLENGSGKFVENIKEVAEDIFEVTRMGSELHYVGNIVEAFVKVTAKRTDNHFYKNRLGELAAKGWSNDQIWVGFKDCFNSFIGLYD